MSDSSHLVKPPPTHSQIMNATVPLVLCTQLRSHENGIIHCLGGCHVSQDTLMFMPVLPCVCRVGLILLKYNLHVAGFTFSPVNSWDLIQKIARFLHIGFSTWWVQAWGGGRGFIPHPQSLFACQFENSHGPAFSMTMKPPSSKNSWIRSWD